MSAVSGILFDKDGTLIDFSASWTPALHQAADEFSNGDNAAAAKVLAASGYDAQSQRVLSGSVLAAGNNEEIAQCWAQALGKTFNPEMTAQLNATFAYHSAHSSVPVTDLPALFSQFKAAGIKIGVATSDSEEGARKTLEVAGALEMMDFVCGFDTGHGIKPESGMVDAFCRELGLSADAVMVVGDNTHDLHMARNGNAKYAIGVLTGTSNRDDLHEADYVLDSIAHIPALLETLNG
ncbi:MAG: HAD family hydrolase [Pseudomonadales bacterium]